LLNNKWNAQFQKQSHINLKGLAEMMQKVLYKFISTTYVIILLFGVMYSVQASATPHITENTAQYTGPLHLLPHKPSYLMPFYNTYTLRDKWKEFFENSFRKDLFNNIEIAYQISFKFPLWKILSTDTIIYGAYSQHSYWQAYADSPFFRVTDYSPEIMIIQPLHWENARGFKIEQLALGAVHQSNGEGGKKERSWNRIYIKTNLMFKQWTLSIKLWHILNTPDLHHYNPDIQQFRGNGKISLAYSSNRYQFTLAAFKRAFFVRYIFPLNQSLRGVVQFFQGYGSDLASYNQHAYSVGIGLALNR
jgi:phospholipase A1/A2